jgi:regulator of extracellular matrix RemA (YlzA/DUF370 family)
MIYQKPLFKNIGFHHIVQINRVVAVIPPGTKSAVNYLRRARAANLFIDASMGHKFRAILILDDGRVVASGISVSTLLRRFSDEYDANFADQRTVEEEMEDIILEAQENLQDED